MSKRTISAVLLGFSLLIFSAGCKKKAPAPAPPPPPKVEQPAPPPAKPSITFSAEPSTIERGQSATLKWSVSGENDISIDNGVGTVQANGSRQVYPTSTTTYTLTATNAGGTSTSTATVNVTVPPPPPPAPEPPKATLAERLAKEVADAYFDYDKSDIREDARATLTKNADALKAILADFPTAVVTVEGHCDERGSAEYNLALGDRRAAAAKAFLVQLGVSADKLKTVSYGKERPQCTEGNESCWQKNRRAHFSAE
jgi:peptidoglycan-associated lipoprotein